MHGVILMQPHEKRPRGLREEQTILRGSLSALTFERPAFVPWEEAKLNSVVNHIPRDSYALKRQTRVFGGAWLLVCSIAHKQGF